ncbi:Integrase, catalytic core [Gossypium australe]|uniref:Integrase, catalytic core n=1 Tax=Gossypium australe TaxID=47621 RepID=A0A5B6WN78_9ROSI|nr:Integrase, catalytic core [Gossypium australe]
MCVDYRDLNKANPNDNFLLPHIVTLMDNMTVHSLFSFMDGFSRYNQIKMHPEDIEKTTFVAMLKKFQLKLHPAKCTFKATSGKLLGFVVSEKGIEIDPDKVKAIQELPLPSTQKEVRGFLGRLNYIAQFISQLTEDCDPIFCLIKKHNLGVWDEKCQKIFDKVKHYLSNALVVMPPSPDKLLILYLAVFGNSMGCSRALEDYEPLNFVFPNEYLMYIATIEECAPKEHLWKLNFDGASNAMCNKIWAVLVSLDGNHYLFTNKLDFDCTNNMADYEACIMGIRAAIERRIKVLEVYGDSILEIYQLKGE